MTSFLTDGIRLSLVLCHTRMNSSIDGLADFNRRDNGSSDHLLTARYLDGLGT